MMRNDTAKNTAVTDRAIPLYSERFDVKKEVTEATVKTLSGDKLGLAGSIAYLDEGSSLYDTFIRSTSNDGKAEKSASAQLISLYQEPLRQELKNIERLVIIGGGSHDSIANQELALVSNMFAHEGKPPLKEIVLVDVSENFLRDGLDAVHEVEQKHGVEFDIKLIRGDFKKVAKNFDTIMTEEFGSKPKDSIKSAVIMTGGTFGNLEGVSSTDRFPGTEIDVQMAHLADYVGNGSTVMFDYFTRLENGPSYYNTSQLSDFFNNIPRIMQRYCKNLQGLEANSDDGYDHLFRYRARALPDAQLIAHELIAEKDQTPRIVNGIERVFPISRNDRLVMMFSLRAHASDIYKRPHQNTGLVSSSYVAHGDLVMHSFKRVGTPGATYDPNMDIKITAPNGEIAPSETHSIASRLNGVTTFVRGLRPLIGPGLSPTPSAG